MKRTLSFLLLVAGLLAPGAVVAQGGGGPPPPPPPLPPVPFPAGNPYSAQKAVLGKILFWDEQLSSDNTVACGTCHGFAGADDRQGRHPGFDGVFNTVDDVIASPSLVRSGPDNSYEPDARFGLDVQVTGRASPSSHGVAWATRLFWDGRATGTFINPETGAVSLPFGGALESQAVAPPLGDAEMAHENRDWAEITAKLEIVQPLRLASNLPPDVFDALNVDGTYPELFEAAFGDPDITAERIAFAIATYERTLIPNQTPYDLFAAGQQNALTQSQRMGLGFFRGPGRCDNCHSLPFFSDNTFRNIGLRPIQEDVGRQGITGQFADRGRFRVVGLRNVGLKSTFMHNGQFTTLGEVVDFYARGGDFPQNQDPLVDPFFLSPQTRAQLLDFLTNGLRDPRVAAETFPFDRPTLYSQTQAPGGNVYGIGSAGTGGFQPELMAQVPAHQGNPDWKIGLRDGLGGSIAYLGFSLTPGSSNIGGVPLNLDPTAALVVLTSLEGAGPGAGYTTWAAPLGEDPSMVGLTVYAQGLVLDASAPGGWAATTGVMYPLF